MKISQQIVFSPGTGSAGFVSVGWQATALALHPILAIKIAQAHADQPARVCGHLQELGKGISERVTLT